MEKQSFPPSLIREEHVLKRVRVLSFFVLSKSSTWYLPKSLRFHFNKIFTFTIRVMIDDVLKSYLLKASSQSCRSRIAY